MKTFKNLTALILVIFSTTAFAAPDKAANEKLEMNYALKVYIDAMAHGKVKPLVEVLDTDTKFTIAQGEKIISFSKADMLKSLKSIENIEQNCDVDYATIQQNGTQAIVKVTQKYPSFSKDSYLSLSKTSKGWKITHVTSDYSK